MFVSNSIYAGRPIFIGEPPLIASAVECLAAETYDKLIPKRYWLYRGLRTNPDT